MGTSVDLQRRARLNGARDIFREDVGAPLTNFHVINKNWVVGQEICYQRLGWSISGE